MIAWLIRYGEIFLKGKNRQMFEKRLIHNIKDCLKSNSIKYSKIIFKSNRVLIYTESDCSCLNHVFGISSFSKAIEVNQDLEAIKEAALKLYKKGSFRISAQRLEKNFKYNSGQINNSVGSHIVKLKKAKVDLENPDTNIGIELLNKKAYIFNKKIPGLGGLPVGIEGNVAILLEDKNSLFAAILMLKRGCSITLIKKTKICYGILKKFCYGSDLKISKTIPKKAKAIVVNDTLDNIKERKFKLPVFRPLLGYNIKNLERWLAFT